MKVRDRIDVIADLLLGAAYADRRFDAVERDAVTRLLQDLLLTDRLPDAVVARIDRFDPARFDLAAAALDFASDPPMNKRRLLELVAHMCQSDGTFDFREDDYIRRLGVALGMEPGEYEDLVIDYRLDELSKRFRAVRMTPAHGFGRADAIVLPPTPPTGIRRP